MSSRAPSIGLSVTSTPVAPPCVASTASVRSPEPDAPRRASSSTLRASARGTSVLPHLLGALMEPHRLQCRSHRCRRRTSSRCRRRLQPYHRQLLPTGTAAPPEQEVGHRASPTTSTPPFLAHRLQLLLCAPTPTSPLLLLAQSASDALPPRLRGRTLRFTDSSAWERVGRAQQSSSRGRPRRILASGPPWPAPWGHESEEAGTGARGRRSGATSTTSRRAAAGAASTASEGRRPARPPQQARGRRPAQHPRLAGGRWPARFLEATARRTRGCRRPTPALGLTTGDTGTWSTTGVAGGVRRRRAWQEGCDGGGLELGAVRVKP
jgi:hypothetical protein